MGAVYSFILRVFTRCIHSAFPVRPLVYFQVRFLVHFLTLKQFRCKQLCVFPCGSRWLHLFVFRTFTAGLFFSWVRLSVTSRSFEWYVVYSPVCSPCVLLAFPSLCVSLFVTPCIQPWVTGRPIPDCMLGNFWRLEQCLAVPATSSKVCLFEQLLSRIWIQSTYQARKSQRFKKKPLRFMQIS